MILSSVMPVKMHQIINIMIESLKEFQQGAQIEDDITMVVIKIN